MPDGDGDALILVTEAAPYEVDGVSVPAGVHHSLSSAGPAIHELAQLCDLNYHHCRSVRLLSDGELNNARVLVLLTIGNTPWTPEQRKTIVRRVTAGSLGILGIHCATDASHDWPEYQQLIGARFDGHPVTAELPVAVLDPVHAAAQHLGPLWRFHDELYLFREFDPENHVVLAIRQGPQAVYSGGTVLPDGDIPVAWSRSVGRGKVFYTALGHFGSAWESRDYLLHILGGLHSLID